VLETIGGPAALDLLDQLSRQADSPAMPYAAAARQRLAERMLDALLARADAAGRAGDLPAAEKLCDQAQALAKSSLPDDERRVASVRDDCRERQKARAAADAPADAAGRLAAMRRRLALADDLAGAVQLADDPKVRECLGLAAKTPEDLTAEEAQVLRAFYLAEAKAADGQVRTNLLSLAMATARPGSEPTEKPFDRSEGVAHDLLAAWSAEQANRGRWTDLLPLLDLPPAKGQNSAPDNGWWREWNGAKSGGTPPPLVLPVQPAGSYQLRLKFVVLWFDAMSVLVPVGDRYARVIVARDDKGGYAAMELSKFSSNMPIGKMSPSALVPAGEYQADITVLQDAKGAVLIRLAVDGRTLIEWKGKASDLEKIEAAPSAPGCPAVVVRSGSVLLRDISVRMLDGKLTPVAVAQPAASPDKPSTLDEPQDEDAN